MSANILPNTAPDSTIDLERRYLAGLWLNPPALDLAIDTGLTGRHFQEPEHSLIFAYCCCKHAAGMRPLIPECVRLAGENGLRFDAGELADLVLTHHRKDNLTDAARAVLVRHRERMDEECRAVCCDALRDGWIEEYTYWRSRRYGHVRTGYRRAG